MNKYSNAIISFNNDPVVHKLRSHYYNKSFWEILGISRKENYHTSFLAWLFTSSENHGLGTAPIVQLLELCCNAPNSQVLDNKMKLAILVRELEVLSSSAETEVAVYSDNKQGRADLVITCNVTHSSLKISTIRIILENKIYSSEHDCQTKLYHDYFTKQNPSPRKIKNIYLFLTPFNVTASCKEFINITYQNLLDAVLSPLLKNTSIKEWAKFIISDYIRNLSIPSDKMNANNTSAGTPLAITEEEKALLTSFWERYNELIIASISVFAANNNTNPDVQNAIELIQMTNATRDRDHSSYMYGDKSYSIKTKLVKQVIQDFVNSKEIATIDSLKDELKLDESVSMDSIFMSMDKYKSELIKEPGKWVGFFGYKDEPSLLIELCHSGGKVAVTTNWPLRVNGLPSNFYYFLEKMQNLGIKIVRVEK